MITAKNALKLTYQSVENKITELLDTCDDAIIKAAKEGLRATSVKLAWREHSVNTCNFVLEELKQQGFEVIMEIKAEYRYITICW